MFLYLIMFLWLMVSLSAPWYMWLVWVVALFCWIGEDE